MAVSVLLCLPRLLRPESARASECSAVLVDPVVELVELVELAESAAAWVAFSVLV
jgi:hypothetical protein